MKKKTLTLNYYRAGKPTGQTRTKTFINNEDTYCPNCGDSCNVWVEESYGDYYVGPSYYCCTCKYKFAIPHLQEIKADGPFADAILELEIIDKLRSPPQEPR